MMAGELAVSSRPTHRISLFGVNRVICCCGWSFRVRDPDAIPTKTAHDKLLDTYLNHLDVENREVP